MTNPADDTEALKHNFFLRGLFKKRGFYNLDQLTPAQYRTSKFLTGVSSERIWLGGDELFAARPDGSEELSPEGRAQVRRAISGLVANLPNSLMMVEGYSAQGLREDRYIRSGQRADAVRRYLEVEF